MRRLEKIGSVSTIAEYDSNLEGFLVALKSQIISSAFTIIYCRSLREGLKTLTFFAPINNYYRGLKKRLKTLTSSASTNNHCYGLREKLETQTSFALTNNHCRGLREKLET